MKEVRGARWVSRLLLVGVLFAGVGVPVAAVANQSDADEEPDAVPVGEFLSRFWELEAEHKRGLYEMRTFHPNYLLPYHYTSSVNRQPTSPTRGPSELNETFRDEEVKIQLSLRTKVLEDFLLPNADVWLAYTQRSLWQAWNHEDSAPFRSTDHRPEIFYVIPLPERLDPIPGPVRLQMIRVGVAHESNGQTEPKSRSWNYWTIGGALQVSQVIVESTYKIRIPEGGDDDDNPDLVNFKGNLDTRVSGLLGVTAVSMTRSSHNLSVQRGSWQMDITHPIRRSMPEGARYHLQIFSGYGETMLDYNHRQNRIGIGFVLLNI
ncbi:MAG: phospholipase A [Idiomarina sp.]|nr:phospholipase A [Idiomarina sp.]